MVFNFDYKPNPEKDDNDVEILNGFTIDLNDKMLVTERATLLYVPTCNNFYYNLFV